MVAPGLEQDEVEPVATTGQGMPSFSNLWEGKVIIYHYETTWGRVRSLFIIMRQPGGG